MKIVAFGHRKNVGKDTAAAFVSTYYRINNPGCKVIKTGFASKVKQISFELYAWAGMRDEEYYEQYRSEREVILPFIGKTVRQIWIEVGNKIREIYIDTWGQYVFNRKCDLLLIKDLRYFPEVNGVNARHGLNVHIINPNVPNTDDEADCALEGINWADRKIINDGDLNKFHTDVINTVKDYLNG